MDSRVFVEDLTLRYRWITRAAVADAHDAGVPLHRSHGHHVPLGQEAVFGVKGRPWAGVGVLGQKHGEIARLAEGGHVGDAGPASAHVADDEVQGPADEFFVRY